MLNFKFACLSLIFFSYTNLVAFEYSDLDKSKTIILVGGASGQRAQCPSCGNYYYVGSHHKCPKS